MQQLATAASGNAASAERLVKADADQDEDQVMGRSGGASRGEADERKQLLPQQHCWCGSDLLAFKDCTVPG